MITNLSNENFNIEAARHYKQVVTSTEEFEADLKRIKYIKKLLTKYRTKGVLEERLILNHLIILGNVFGNQFLCRMLFLKMLPEMKYIKPFLLFLNYLPEVVYNIEGYNYHTPSIESDLFITIKLKELITVQ